MKTREQAIKWFNEKDAYNKSELSHKYFKDTVSYNFTALTGREIEQIWQKEVNKNKYLNRLKQQYKKYKQAEVDKNESLHYSFGITYRIERTFCLDCELISFNDIEVMENEVNQSF
jgi:hypothetical protein